MSPRKAHTWSPPSPPSGSVRLASLPTCLPIRTGLPGISTLSNMVGALLTVGLIACVAGLVLAAIVWAIGSHSSNPHLAGRGKSGVLVAFVAAVLIGGANVLVDFFVTTGKGI